MIPPAKNSIAVVCPTYNSQEFIGNTLSCILHQTRQPDEIIVSDDGSTDGTGLAVTQFIRAHPGARMSFIQNEHKGAGAARNHGIKKSSCEWIALIDSDDLWYLQKLEVVRQHLLKYPEYNFFCHSELSRDDEGQERPLRYFQDYDPGKDLMEQLYWKNFFSTSAVVCQKKLFEEAGYFNENLYSAQDYEMWLRMTPWMEPFHIPDVLGVYRVRRGNISSASLWRRYQNAMTVLNIHRAKAGLGLYAARALWLSLSYLKSFASASLRPTNHPDGKTR